MVFRCYLLEHEHHGLIVLGGRRHRGKPALRVSRSVHVSATQLCLSSYKNTAADHAGSWKLMPHLITNSKFCYHLTTNFNTGQLHKRISDQTRAEDKHLQEFPTMCSSRKNEI
eukprot:1672135-Amphidinium_carterae.1